MTGDEWCERFGRFRRTISADQLRRVLFRQRGECTWCGKAVPKRRRTWCSQACLDQYMVRTPDGAARRVSLRDNGVCSLCGRDTERMHYLFRQLRGLSRGMRPGRGWSEPIPGLLDTLKALVQHWRSLGFNCSIGHNFASLSHLWEADHIIPVSEGGGLCGLDGYKTLCIPCHKGKSAEAAKRKSIVRRMRR